MLERKAMLNHSYRISMTQANSWIAEGNFTKVLVLRVYQKPEALKQTNGSLQ